MGHEGQSVMIHPKKSCYSRIAGGSASTHFLLSFFDSPNLFLKCIRVPRLDIEHARMYQQRNARCKNIMRVLTAGKETEKASAFRDPYTTSLVLRIDKVV